MNDLTPIIAISLSIVAIYIAYRILAFYTLQWLQTSPIAEALFNTIRPLLNDSCTLSQFQADLQNLQPSNSQTLPQEQPSEPSNHSENTKQEGDSF